jgi:hypothetical protein
VKKELLERQQPKKCSSWLDLFFISNLNKKSFDCYFYHPNNDIQIKRWRWNHLRSTHSNQKTKTKRQRKRNPFPPPPLDSCLIHRMEWENPRQSIHHFLRLSYSERFDSFYFTIIWKFSPFFIFLPRLNTQTHHLQVH